ncbi:MAG TPA: ribokinase [Rectinemataceae bacterium]|nr:ribokinase [Rectinemataceae bacterium]
MTKFCVVGSLNMDMVTRVERFPQPGETISGLSFNIFPGGKGANQAVALARLGARVEMVGALGDDVLGNRYAEILAELHIGRSAIARESGVSTGTASIEVSEAGENHIVIVAGANALVAPAKVVAARPIIESCSSLLLQLEIPMDSVLEAARIAKAAGLAVILDPAPARELPEALYPLVSVITPNEHEARLLTGENTTTESGIARAGEKLCALGAACAIIKAGPRGAFVVEGGRCRRIPGYKVKVVDTTAAGDSFNAGLALALGEGRELAEAVRFANAVGALSTTREGAQSAMPSLEEARAFMAAQAT